MHETRGLHNNEYEKSIESNRDRFPSMKNNSPIDLYISIIINIRSYIKLLIILISAESSAYGTVENEPHCGGLGTRRCFVETSR
ncbi:unnamed protein product [Euphydryas editha]|uniref:Uncharacterized protein n=1 Tax=Euphydryas editha TaxID=104508 RepID=A0AAU9TFY9_EUPED|nr:unnamed protein product [Euphydryas editha]